MWSLSGNGRGWSRVETVTIRVFETDIKGWRREANLRGITVSEWIRRQCNQAIFFSGNPSEVADEIARGEQGDGSTNHKDVSRLGRAPVSRRRTSAAGRRSRTVANGNQSPATTSGHSFSGKPEPDGLSGPEPVGAIHTATSNRLTCLCPTCSNWRKLNAIPLGGLPKRPKATR